MVHCDFKPVPEGVAFRPIPGFGGQYEVSRDGLVLSRARAFRHGEGHRGVSSFLDHILTPLTRDGHETLMLPLPVVASPGSPPWKRQKRHSVRRLIYLTWKGPIPDGYVLIEVESGAADLAGRLIPVSRGFNARLNNPRGKVRDKARLELELMVAGFDFA